MLYLLMLSLLVFAFRAKASDKAIPENFLPDAAKSVHTGCTITYENNWVIPSYVLYKDELSDRSGPGWHVYVWADYHEKKAPRLDQSEGYKPPKHDFRMLFSTRLKSPPKILVTKKKDGKIYLTYTPPPKAVQKDCEIWLKTVKAQKNTEETARQKSAPLSFSFH